MNLFTVGTGLKSLEWCSKMKVNNPYTEEKRKLMLLLDSEKDSVKRQVLTAQLETVEKKSRLWIQNILDKVQPKVDHVVAQKEEVQEISSPRQQYKTAISLYRYTSNILLELRELKKQCRLQLGIDNSQKKEVPKETQGWFK